jgi:cytoskeletal protein CcmA (bactofilin family)
LTADTTFPYNYDIGFFSHYEKESGYEKHTGIARDYTTDIWGFFSNATSSPGATVNWSETDLIYDTVRVGDLVASNTTPSTSTTTGALRVAGGAGIEGKLYIANTGDVSANIGTLYLGNIRVNANLGAYQLYANSSISTLFLGNASTQANLGAFQIYSNAAFATLDANIGTLYLGNASTQANLGTLFLGNVSTQANIGTLFLGNVSTQANIGTLFLGNASTQANIGSIRNQLDTLDANVGSYQAYANVYLGVSTTFIVTDSGSNEYIINGEDNPPLYLIRGQRYNFSVDAAGHPLWIKTAPSIGSGDQYNAGVTNNGEDGGVVVFEVPLTAPDVLYYISQFDAAMTNELRVVNFPTLDANIGTLFLGNVSTQANLGAFQTYANATFTTYSNANVTAYLPIHTGNISAGNIDVINKAAVGTVYTSNGVYWSGNGNPYSTGGGGVTYTASTTPPVGPAIGDQWYDTVDGILYEYIDDGDTDQWVDIISPTFSGASPIAFTSNITVGGNILITDGIYWVSNGEPYASGGGSFSGEDTVLRANVGAYQLYANANIGTLFLGNISTNANLGAFQIYSNANAGSQAEAINSFNSLRLAFNTYANTKIGTNTNSNLVVVATTTSTNTTTGALVVGGGAGIAGAIHVGSSGTFAGLIQTTATTAATSTATGALYVAGGAGIVGNLHAGGNVILGSSTTTSNVVVTGTRTSTTTTTGALVVRGGAGIVGNVYTDRVYTTTGIFWSGNNAVFAPPASSIFSSNVVAASGTASSSTTTGALVVQGGAGISGDVWTGAGMSIGTDLTVNRTLRVVQNLQVDLTATIQEVSITGTTAATNLTNGVLRIPNGGGISVYGNIHTRKLYTLEGLYWSGNSQPFQAEAAPTFLSNLVAASGTASVSTTTGALVVAGAGGLGVGGDLNTNAGSTVAGWTVGGLLWAACTTPATSATSGGGLLVSGGARFTGNIYASGNIYLGANTSSNLVANATTTSTSTTTGALVVRGGAGVAGNLYVGSEFVIPGGGKITSSGIANFLEKANVVVSALAATINVDLSVASVMYWTSNSTTNMTANIRGDETTPLNTILAVGQSVTTALFIPNGVSNYYVNSLKIDNTTVTPAYSGNSSPTLGNPDSIDIYSFTILKTADATFKVFATQSQFQHPG